MPQYGEEKTMTKKNIEIYTFYIGYLITKGQTRVIEKIKEIRQSFSKAVISGTRNGSGKIVSFRKLGLFSHMNLR